MAWRGATFCEKYPLYKYHRGENKYKGYFRKGILNMGIEEIKLHANLAAADTTKTNTNVTEEKVGNVDFSKAHSIGVYEQNSKSNSFLREYLIGKAGGKLPEGFGINISSPKEYSDEFKALLRSVRVDIYGARVADMFKLLVQDAGAVEKRVAEMKISDEEKSKIIALKAMFDDYYKVEGTYNGKSYNLLHLSEPDKAEIAEISPEFAKFLEEEQPELLKHTIDFTKDEISRLELSEAGMSSRYMAGALAPALLIAGGMGVWRSRKDKVQMKANPSEFLAEQKAIYENGNPLTNTAKSIKNKVKNFKLSNLKTAGKGFKNPFAGLKTKNRAALIGILGTTLMGSWDDLAGCVKDYAQDSNNFGDKTALAINIPAAALGIASSFAIAPMVENQIAFNRAEKFLAQKGVIQKTSALKGAMKKGGRFAALGLGLYALKTGGKFLLNSVQGCITTSSSSGSSWGSMAGTRLVMANNGDKLAEKNIIDKKDNTSKATTDNMMAYEAYDGKWEGISKSDPALGVLFGGTGLLTHSNPVLQTAAFTLQGCSETLTACGYQLLGDNVRGHKLDKKKAELAASVQKN